MKKLFVLVFAIALCLAVLCFGASADYDENGFGVGNDEGKYQPAEQDENGVYQIGNAGQLYWFAQYVNTWGLNILACAELTENITINEGVLDAVANSNTDSLNKWTPIYLYLGTFDGNGHTISGLYLHGSELSPGGNTGMFGSVLGTVKNLALADSYIGVEFRAAEGENPSCVGAICGTVGAKATVSGCSFEGTVSAVTAKGTDRLAAGGICGQNNGNLENCTFYGSLTAMNVDDDSKSSNTILSLGGGICGWNIGTVKGCKNYGEITGGGYNPAVGGICGEGLLGKVEGTGAEVLGTIQNCENYGEVTSITKGGEGNSSYAGGIWGCGSGKLIDCKNNAKVLGANNAGGIAGNIENGEITSCTNSAEITAYYQCVGGICGTVSGSVAISECINSGDIAINDTSEGGNAGVGGICGGSWIPMKAISIVNCYNSGNLSGYQKHDDIMYIFGIFGSLLTDTKYDIDILNCCNAGTITYRSPMGGAAYTGGVCLTLAIGVNVEHCFWLADASGGADSGARTKEQFARGEVAYELNKWDNTEYGGKVWKVGDDGYPVLSGGTNEIVEVTFTYLNVDKPKMICYINKGEKLREADTDWISGNMRLFLGADLISVTDLLSKTFSEDTEIIVQVVEDGEETQITAIVTGSASKVYDGTTDVPASHNLSIKLIGVVAGETVTATAESYTFDNKNVGAGKTITANGITLGGADAEKYVLVSDTVSAEVGTIERKELTASLSGNLSKEYDSTADAPEGLSIALDGVITDDDITATAVCSFDDASVGSGKTITATGITLTGEDAGNYTLSSTTVSSNVGEITPKIVTITADDKSAYMGDAMPGLSYKADGFLDHDGLTAEPDLSCNADMTKAGTYEITVSGGAASDNYKLVYKNGTLTVRQSWIVTVKPGNGAADEISYIIPGESFTIPDAPKNSGYIFLGWRCGDETYKAGETIKVTSDMTFTAVWGNLPDVDPGEPEPEPELPFYDVAKGDWFYDAVKYVYYADLMDGVEEHIFAPNDTLTRAMVWTIIARAEGVDTDGGASWYAKAQEWVTAMGISDGENPNAAITRQELVTMLWRLAGEPALGSGINAPDAGSVSSWAQQAMSWAVYIGLIEGDENGAVTPAATATRAQAAAIFMRYLEA